MGDRSRGGYASRGGFRTTDSSRDEPPRATGRRDDRRDQGRGAWRSRGATGRGDGAESTSWRWRRTTTRASADASSAHTERTPPLAINADVDEIGEKLVALKLTGEAVRGECETMCSSEEVKMRQLTKDVSRFEIAPGSSLSSAMKAAGQLPWAVKKYRRPAAGRIEVEPYELRPPHVLELTLQHLFTKVLPWTGCGFDWSCSSTDVVDPVAKPQDFLALYYFISDRVRSVRQDFVIQQVGGLCRIQALMQIARFYVLASFRATQILDFGDNTIDWSETLNDQQLASALTEIQAQFQSMEAAEVLQDGSLIQLHEDALALDVLLHLPDARAVSLLLVKTSPPALLRRPGLRRVLALFVAFQTGDFVSFSRCFRQLPELQRCLALRYLSVFWPRTLSTMNKAYGKIDRFTLEEIAETLDLSGAEDTVTLCKALNVHVEDPPALKPVPPVDSWEDTTVVAAPEPPRPASYVQFKISAMRDELEKPVEWQLTRRKAASIQKTLTTRYTATELVVG